jgi:hypothetical protein
LLGASSYKPRISNTRPQSKLLSLRVVVAAVVFAILPLGVLKFVSPSRYLCLSQQTVNMRFNAALTSALVSSAGLMGHVLADEVEVPAPDATSSAIERPTFTVSPFRFIFLLYRF